MIMTWHLFQQHMVATFIVAIKSKFDVEQLQGDIDVLIKWSKLWILSFNISKSKLETLVLILILIYFHTNNCVLSPSLICSKLYQLFLPALLKTLPIELFYSHTITYNSYFIVFALLFCVLTSRETWT